MKTHCEQLPFVARDLCEEIGDTLVDYVINGGLLVNTDANQVCEIIGLCERVLR